MTHRDNGTVLLFVTAALLAGCAGLEDPEEGELLGEAEGELLGVNGLNPNALSPSVLTLPVRSPIALSLPALSSNPLDPSSLASSALTALRDLAWTGDVSRGLLRYTVECALTASQSFSYTWTNLLGTVRNETYWGLLGLAPAWSTQPLSAQGQEWVSACLASRINWYGASVTISARSPNPTQLRTTSAEQSEYPMLEGAFWGDVFASPPRAFACYHAPNVAHSRSLLRDCATGHPAPITGVPQDCGVVHVVGSCADHCSSSPASQGVLYTSCAADPGGAWTSRVITIYLP